MRRVTLRSLWEHKRRLISTVLAIVLGVAFMSGTFVFADTIDKVFDDLFAEVNEGIDVQVQGEELFEGGFGGGSTTRKLLDLSLVDEVAAVDGIERVVPFVQTLGFGSTNRVVGPDGELLGSSSGPPTLIESWITDETLSPYRLFDGAPPAADDEIALNVAAVEDAGLSIGDTVTVISQFGSSEYRLVGSFTFGGAKSSAGSISADFTLAEAQRLGGFGDQVQVLLAAGDGSVEDAVLAGRVQAALPDGYEALTGEEAAAQTASAVQEGFAFFRQILVIFGAIALLVGTFIISNTFSILIAQRTRELALLRAIGASRRQVLTSVLLEAAVIGLFAAVLGLLGGIALAIGVTALLSAIGADLPSAGLVVSSTTISIAFAVGLGVTVLASLLPAVQATRVPPLAALRDVAIDRSGASRIRTVAGVLLLVGAVALLGQAAGGDSDALPAVGLGALLLIVGAIVIGPVLAEPTVRVLGAWLPRLRGITGVLATENAARSPKRTSATASALLIGVALVGFITIFAASAKASIEKQVDTGFTGDFVIQSEASGFGPPSGFPATVADAAADAAGVESVASIGFTQAQITYPDGTQSATIVTAIDPAAMTQAYDVQMAEGQITDLGPDGVIVPLETAEGNDLAVGDTVDVQGNNGTTVELTIAAISDDTTLLRFLAIDLDTLGEIVTEKLLVRSVVTASDGADLAVVQADLDRIVAATPLIEVLDRDGFVGTLTDQITSFLNIIYGLLLLSILIALIGIANTLSLSIHERTRELGLLRAVGMSRSQLRAAVRWEAVIIAVLGTMVGLGVGLIVSWALVTTLGGLGLSTFAVPVRSMATVVVLAAVLGVLASIRPSRRAAKLNVLDAIATE